ncbi:hypothetical protein PCC6912_39770 [Chlorogloeopsis fritschii PCC 6912]|uniref:Uncharacterized protein n=1 Tax=Chlorogloeopsis fritschii PCC 6912 TaxID=211165 RepID=A0A3S0XNV9_CHLFR|nr:hypothetical protein [Chlorogloeopsis fritschii]RUR77018.1 hypothetical protein PCC6912_39770 [Chlorogloeopsis fritschii PCC 6912]
MNIVKQFTTTAIAGSLICAVFVSGGVSQTLQGIFRLSASDEYIDNPDEIEEGWYWQKKQLPAKTKDMKDAKRRCENLSGGYRYEVVQDGKVFICKIYRPSR